MLAPVWASTTQEMIRNQFWTKIFKDWDSFFKEKFPNSLFHRNLEGFDLDSMTNIYNKENWLSYNNTYWFLSF